MATELRWDGFRPCPGHWPPGAARGTGPPGPLPRTVARVPGCVPRMRMAAETTIGKYL